MCFVKGLITNSHHRYKSGNITFFIKAKKLDTLVTFETKHISGDMRFELIDANKREVHVINTDNQVFKYLLLKNSTLCVHLTLRKHCGSYKITKQLLEERN